MSIPANVLSCDVRLPEGAELVEELDRLIAAYQGNVEVLERAVGMLMVARHLGWKPLLLMHDPRTVRGAERLLGMTFRKLFAEAGPWAEKSFAWRAFDKTKSFWRTVRGDFPHIRSNRLDEGG